MKMPHVNPKLIVTKQFIADVGKNISEAKVIRFAAQVSVDITLASNMHKT